jgi:hypothetical protein
MSGRKLFMRALMPGAVAIGYCGFVLKDQFAAHDVRREEIDEERRKDALYDKKTKANSLGNFPKQ